MQDIDRKCRYCKSYSLIKRYHDGLIANCTDPEHEGEIVLGLAEGCLQYKEDPEKVGKLPLVKAEEAETCPTL